MEGNSAWQPVPGWASCFVQLGYAWLSLSPLRRIAFVSTPCDSAAAGLIALGAMLRRMEQPKADDLSAHLSRLRRLSQETDSNVVLRHRIRRGRFTVVRSSAGSIAFQEMNKKDPARHILLDSHASDWYFDGEPPVEAGRGAQLPFDAFYRTLLPDGGQICAENLRRTDSHVVLAGRSGGRSFTERLLRAIRFRTAGLEAALSELLAVYRWQPDNVSRVRYANPRTGSRELFDRPGPPPGLVIADGPGAFGVIVDHPETENASVVAVVPRTADPDKLDRTAERVGALTQWYAADTEAMSDLPALAAGVDMAVLRRRF